MQGVEAEGIDFILRFRDQASDQINTAEHGYRRLVSSMQEVINVHRSFVTSVMESMGQFSRKMETQGSPVVTPLTMNERQIGLMGKFQAAAAGWFASTLQSLTGYSKTAAASAQQTEFLANAVTELGEVLKGIGSGFSQVLPFLEKFTEMKFGNLQSEPLRKIMIDLREIVKYLLQINKLTPDLKKSLQEDNKAFGEMAGTTKDLQQQLQNAHFHGKDNEDQLKRQRKEAAEADKAFGSLANTMKTLSGFKSFAIGAGTGLVANKAVQAYSSVEDMAQRIQARMEDTNMSVEGLTKRIIALASGSRWSSREVAESLGEIAIKTGRITAETEKLSFTAIKIAKTAGTPISSVASALGDLINIYHLTEAEAEKFGAMAYSAQKGARRMDVNDFLGGIFTADTATQGMYKRLADMAGMGDKLNEFVLTRLAPSMMAAQKVLSNIGGDVGETTRMVQGLITQVAAGNDSIKALATQTGSNFSQWQDMVGQGKFSEVMVQQLQAMRKLYHQFDGDTKAQQNFLKTWADAYGTNADTLRVHMDAKEEDFRKLAAELSNFSLNMSKLDKDHAQKIGTWSARWEAFTAQVNKIFEKGQQIFEPFGKAMDWVTEKLKVIANWDIGKGDDAIHAGADVITLISTAASIFAAYKAPAFLKGLLGISSAAGAAAPAVQGAATTLGGLATQAGVAAAQSGAAGAALGFAGAKGGPGILSRVWTWLVRIGSAAGSAALSLLGLGGKLGLGKGAATAAAEAAAAATGITTAQAATAAAGAATGAAGVGFFSRLAGWATRATAAIGGLSGAFGLVSKAFGILSVAILTWDLAEWAYKNIAWVKKFADSFSSLIDETIPALGKAFDWLAEKWARSFGSGAEALKESLNDLGKSNQKLFEHLKSQGVVIEQGKMGADEWNKKLVEAQRNLNQQKQAQQSVAAAAPKVGQQGPVLTENERQLQALYEGLKAQGIVIERGTQDLNEWAQQLLLAHREMRENGGKINPEHVAAQPGVKPTAQPQQAAPPQQAPQNTEEVIGAMMYEQFNALRKALQNPPPEKPMTIVPGAKADSRDKADMEIMKDLLKNDYRPSGPNPRTSPATQAMPAPQTVPVTAKPLETPPVPQTVPVAAKQPAAPPVPQTTPPAAKPVAETPSVTVPDDPFIKWNRMMQEYMAGQRKEHPGSYQDYLRAHPPTITPPPPALPVEHPPVVEAPEQRVKPQASLETIPRPDPPRLMPASFHPDHDQNEARYMANNQAGDDMPSWVSSLARQPAVQAPAKPGDSGDAVVKELRNIATMIAGAIQQNREPKQVPQTMPVYRPRFGQLAEGSI